MITRRRLAALAAARLAAGPARAQAEPSGDPEAAFAAIEAGIGGRLGVAVLDAGSGGWLRHRAGERFPLCSTFKLLAAAAILARVDAGAERLDRPVAYGAADLVDYSPVTGARVGEGAMPLSDLCAAALTLSDNTAGNLMLARIGGPEGLTAFARGLGDAATRLDRTEPALNEALPGDPRDTTTPAAMVGLLDALLLRDALAPASRARLEGWLRDCRTGDARLRAGLPRDWRVGDKTGTGERGSACDVGVLRPPGRAPLLAAVYLTGAGGTPEARSAAIAAVGRAVAAAGAPRRRP